MSEYMKPRHEDGTGFLIETPDPKPATVRYFWMLSADFVKPLDEPVREYSEHGYTIKNVESGQGFMADTIEMPADASVTRMGLLVHAMKELLDAQNEGRRAQGKRIMFDESHIIAKSFDCGRNEL
jgi:hypothetical protein